MRWHLVRMGVGPVRLVPPVPTRRQTCDFPTSPHLPVPSPCTYRRSISIRSSPRRRSRRSPDGTGITGTRRRRRSEEHTSELQSRENLVCRLLLEKKKKKRNASAY